MFYRSQIECFALAWLESAEPALELLRTKNHEKTVQNDIAPERSAEPSVRDTRGTNNSRRYGILGDLTRLLHQNQDRTDFGNYGSSRSSLNVANSAKLDSMWHTHPIIGSNGQQIETGYNCCCPRSTVAQEHEDHRDYYSNERQELITPH